MAANKLYSHASMFPCLAIEENPKPPLPPLTFMGHCQLSQHVPPCLLDFGRHINYQCGPAIMFEHVPKVLFTGSNVVASFFVSLFVVWVRNTTAINQDDRSQIKIHIIAQPSYSSHSSKLPDVFLDHARSLQDNFFNRCGGYCGPRPSPIPLMVAMMSVFELMFSKLKALAPMVQVIISKGSFT
jgi:hypothetical protein